jgi:hypothetical protein
LKKFSPLKFPISLLLTALTLFISSVQADTLYSTGSSTWDTSTSNWGTSTGGPYNTTSWNNATPDNAIFEGTGGGTITLAETITSANLTFTNTDSSSFTISGHTLNFGTGSVIANSDNRSWQTITSAITGRPAVETKDNGAGNQYKGIRFQPSSGTVSLGEILNPNNTGSTDKAGFSMAGTTVGNSAGNITYASNDRYGTVYKEDSGTWTTGNITTGTVSIYDGTLIVNGTVDLRYKSLYITGGTLSGNATIYKVDRRESFNFVSGTSIAPGDGVGSITFDWGTSGSPNASQWTTAFRTGMTYEWEVGSNVNDTVHIEDGRLIMEGLTFKVKNAGGVLNPDTQYPILTYGSLDSKTLSLASIIIDVSEYDSTLDTTTASFVDNGSGTIYLTGLGRKPNGTIFKIE